MQLRLTRREFCKYDTDASIVTFNVTGATPATYDYVLVREDGYGDVARLRKVTGATGQFGIPLTDFAAGVVTDYSPTVGGINYARQGMYHVEARQTTGTLVAASASFPVSVVTVEQFKRTHLMGIPLYVDAVLALVKQPTWATCGYIDPGLLKGKGTLFYDASANTVTFRDGAPVAVDLGEALQLYPGDQDDAYIEITIDEAPTVDTSVDITVDNLRLRDDDLRGYLWRAYDYVQQQLQVRLETTIFTTDPALATGHYDEVIDALPFQRGYTTTIPVRRTAAQPLRKVTKLSGYFGTSQAVVVPPEWVTVQEKAAIITLVPISGAGMSTTALGVYGVNPSSLGAQIADYWHVDGISGLASLEKDGRSIREAIARVAAVDALSDLSLAATTGRTSFTAQREGVSESWNYGSQGAYGEKIGSLGQWLEKNMPRLKTYFGGIKATVL
jgi:hypothetical protein